MKANPKGQTSSTTRAQRRVKMVEETSFFSRLAFGSTNEVHRRRRRHSARIFFACAAFARRKRALTRECGDARIRTWNRNFGDFNDSHFTTSPEIFHFFYLFASLCKVCFLHHLQNFFNSNFFSPIFFDL